MKKIVHIINGLGSGGAENMLLKLLKYSNKDRYYHEVIVLTNANDLQQEIENENIKVHYLHLKISNLLKSWIRARAICKEFDIINTWLYHSDLFGYLIAKSLRKEIIWNIRHCNLEKSANKISTLSIVKVNALLSRWVNCITCNSMRALEVHKEIGYINSNFSIISNGFELDRFKFSETKRNLLKRELSIDPSKKIIITVGRWNIQKDYTTLLKAVSLVLKEQKNFIMIMVGKNLDNGNRDIIKLRQEFQLADNLLLLGRRSDIPELLSLADIYVSSSIGESFSNSIGEAMACELPCIVTDVGDSKNIVGDTGFVIKPGDYKALAGEIKKQIGNIKLERCNKARDRVIKLYDIKKIINQIESVFENTYL